MEIELELKADRAAEATRKEALASQKEAEAAQKEVDASKKEDEASQLEAEAFKRDLDRNSANASSTARPIRRGPSRFKVRKEAIALRKDAVASRKEAETSRKDAVETRKDVENGTRTEPPVARRPSLSAATRRNERPTRNFARRRPSGGSGIPTTTQALTPSPSATRRPYRIASRRRQPPSSTTTSSTSTTPQSTTLMVDSDELMQDVGDIDAIEDPTFESRSAKKEPKIPRRPLINLKDDQNASPTNDEEKRRQSKKYSSTFKANQLEDLLKKDEVTTEAVSTLEDNAEAAIAIVTHQLITAPLPSTDSESTSGTNKDYTEYTKTPIYEEYTTAYRTVPTEDFVQSTIGDTYSIYDTPRVTNINDYTTPDLSTTKLRQPYPTTNYELKTTYETPKTTSRQSIDQTDINIGKVNLNYPTTVTREGFTNIPTDFGGISPTTFESPKLSTLSRYPTPEYQTVTNQYVPTTNREYTITREYIETTEPRTYSTPRTIAKAIRDFPSPNVITSGYTGVQRGGIKYENDKLSTIPVDAVKYTTLPVEDTRSTRTKFTVSEDTGSTVGYTSSSQEPAGFFTKEYLLESPVTKTYDDEYQYLSPTTPQTTTRKVFRKKIQKRISTTIRPTTSTVPSTTPTFEPVTTPRSTLRSRTPAKPFEKIAKSEPNRTYRPVVNYDYYDDSSDRIALKYAEGTKVILHGKGSIECLDVGNFPHPSSCKKFISCARMEFGALLGWEYICPKGLSFDPVGGICNWSAGLGCDEKDV